MRFMTLPHALAWMAGVCFTAAPAAAEVRLPALFSDHMVLQADRSVPVWGWADEGERVTVTIAGQTKRAMPRAGGRWTVRLDELPAGGPHTMTVEGSNRLEISDVLVGEVWLCSGQSNMVMPVSRCKDLEQEKAKADLPKIRFFTVAANPEAEPVDDVEGEWVVVSPETVQDCSGTAYFFGRAIFEQLDTPVGLLVSAVGGTPIEAWTSASAQDSLRALDPILDPWEERAANYDEAAESAKQEEALAKWEKAVAKARETGKTAPRKPKLGVHPDEDTHAPARLFNGMIAPLVGYGIRGALWYQGENNASRLETASLYRLQLPLLARDWRRRWGEGDFPFAWVQLPNFRQPVDEPVQTTGWTLVQESMLQSLRNVPNSGMAVTIDIGESDDIHPKNKQDVGARLAKWALATVYDKQGPATGPLYGWCTLDGDAITVHFKHAGKNLETADGSAPRGFAIAGQDKKWYPATAEIRGTQVIVSSAEVPRPVAVRYAWADNPDCNLLGASGIPASPFRTDRWKE